jgi:hypothetical protein
LNRRRCRETSVFAGCLYPLFAKPKTTDHKDRDAGEFNNREQHAPAALTGRFFGWLRTLVGQRQRRCAANDNLNIRTLGYLKVHGMPLNSVFNVEHALVFMNHSQAQLFANGGKL